MSSKQTLTYREYVTVVGLLEVAARHTRELNEIETALIEITGEVGRDGKPLEPYSGGHCGDQCYSLSPDADQLMSKIGIKVVKTKAARRLRGAQ
jgi:hypothetical protein